MRKYICLFGFVYISFILVSPTSAQDWNTIFTYELDAEYYMAEGNFSKAADTYAKALKKFPESANLKFKIGYCLLKTPDRKSESISYLEEAVAKISDKYDAKSIKEANAPPEALYHLGMAYMVKNDFDNASRVFNEYKKYVSPDDTEATKRVNQALASCEFAKQMSKKPIGLNYSILGPEINNMYNNICPVLSGDGKTLAFTSVTAKGNKIYITTKDENGNWTKPREITRYLGSRNLTTSFLSYEGKELYLIEHGRKRSDIVVSFLQKRRWSSTVKIAKPINSKSNETHVCVTKDGNTVYFTSDRKGSLGGFDIWVSTINNGRWSDAINLGPNVNTEFDEVTPFLTPDEKYLFFSSQGHNSMGGFDIFYTNLEGSPNVKNIGYPLNTPSDETFFFPTSLTSGLIPHYSPDGYGKLDITMVDIVPQVDLKLNIMLADNAPTDKPYNVKIIEDGTQQVIESFSSKGKSQLKSKIKPGKYVVTATGKGFDEAKTNFEVPAKPDESEYQLSLVLNPVVIQQPVAQLEEPKSEIEDKQDNNQTAEDIEDSHAAKTESKKTDNKEAKENIDKSEIASKEQEQDKALPSKPTPTAAPVPRMDFNKSMATSTLAKTTYSIQLLASLHPVDYNYFNLDSISVTISPEGYYRYSIGNTDNIQEIEMLQQKLRNHGYNNVWVRINREHPGYTIQFLALQKPKSIKMFEELSDVMVYRGKDGMYRYCVGKYSTPEEALTDIERIKSLGYSDAFIRVLGK